ncbi:MAG: PorT family protein [Bacteroidetes bacterium]|nr:MAG: PorT family protein [Bacteroidota bacterium]
MKTKFLFLSAALLFSFASMAQFHIGAKAGANISKVEGHSFNDQFKYGYHLGGFMEIPISKKLTIQPEVLFNQYSTVLDSSYKNIYDGVFSSQNGTNIKLNYLSIPILLEYKMASFFRLQAGPQFGILIDQDRNLLQNGGDAFRRGDLSMLAGAEIQIMKLRITGRYAIGLSNINDIDNQDKWTNQGFQLSLGLAL